MENHDKSDTCLIFGQFTGEPGVAVRLNRTVRILVQEQGVRRFIAGPGNDFDWLAAQSVVRLKPFFKDLVLLRLHPSACWDTVPLPKYFDGEIFSQAKPQHGRLHNLCKAARTILPEMEHLVLYEPFPCSWECGVVADALRLAQRKKIDLLDISQPDREVLDAL